jgi:hypothetical protein
VIDKQSYILGSLDSDVSLGEIDDIVKTITASVPGLEATAQPDTCIAVLEIPSHSVALVKNLLGDRFFLEPNGVPRLVQTSNA